MDKLHTDIIRLLKEDSRYTADEIASLLNADVKKTAAAIADMEKQGIIVKYNTIINDEKLGIESVEALIEVKVSPQQARGFEAVAEEIMVFDEVKSVYLMSGAYDLAVFITGKTLREVAMFVSEKLSVMQNVLSTATHFILKKYKIEGVIPEDSGNKRLAVQP